MSRVLVVTADTHGAPHEPNYKIFLESRYHDDFEHFLADRKRRREAGEGVRFGELSVFKPFGFEDNASRSAYAQAMSPNPRLEYLESQGIVAEVIFPDDSGDNEVPFSGRFGSPAGELKEEWSAELNLAGQWAYNRWLEAATDPDRQVGLPVVPADQPAEAIKVIEWAAERGMRGVLFSTMAFDDAVWAACAAANLPVHFHGLGGEMPDVGNWPLGKVGPWFMSVKYHRARWGIAFLTLSGVFHRHPNLRVVFTEVGADWIPRSLTWMDYMWESAVWSQSAREFCPRRPSEYWHEQCWAAPALISRDEVQMRHEIGTDRLMYGTDFPHRYAAWDANRLCIRALFGTAKVPEDETRAILGLNAVRLYNLDLELLQKLAERCGPTLDEVLNTPIGDDELGPEQRMSVCEPARIS